MRNHRKFVRHSERWAMSDEELAEIFTHYAYEAHGKWYGPDQKNYWSMSIYALETRLDWLCQPAKEDT